MTYNPNKYDKHQNSGRFNRRITLQTRKVTKDAGGRPKTTYEDFTALWAAWEPLRSREYFAAAAVNAENTVRYRIRYRADISPDMRVVEGTKVYDITGIIEDPYGDRKCSYLLCKELVPSGG